MNKWDKEKEDLTTISQTIEDQIKKLQVEKQRVEIRLIYVQGAIDALKDYYKENET